MDNGNFNLINKFEVVTPESFKGLNFGDFLPQKTYYANIYQIIADSVLHDDVFKFMCELGAVRPGSCGLAVLFENDRYVSFLPEEGIIVCLPSGGLHPSGKTMYDSPVVKISKEYGHSFVKDHLFEVIPFFRGTFFIFFTES